MPTRIRSTAASTASRASLAAHRRIGLPRHADLVLRWAMLAPRVFVSPGSIVDPFTIPTGDRAIDDVLAQRSTVTAYLLDLADRLRAELDEE